MFAVVRIFAYVGSGAVFFKAVPVTAAEGFGLGVFPSRKFLSCVDDVDDSDVFVLILDVFYDTSAASVHLGVHCSTVDYL